MKNLVVVVDFLSLILYLGTALLILLYNLKRPAQSRVYLIIAFLLISGSFSIWLIENFTSFALLSVIREYLFALGLIFFTTVVVEVLSGSVQISFYYLLLSLGLTSLFTLTAMATLDFNLSRYYLHWSFPIWLIVQIIILGTLSYFLVASAIKTRKKGTIVYAIIFILLFLGRFIEGFEIYVLKEFLEPSFSIERVLHLTAAILVFTYAAYGLIKISLPKKKAA